MRRALFACVVLIGLALVSEGLARLRWTDADTAMSPQNAILVDHPTLFWTMRPSAVFDDGGVEVRTNRFGMRSPEHVVPRPPGVRRVLLLGESTTMGAFVEQDRSYAAVLQARLDAAHPGAYEVINAGTGAWTIWQSSVLLQELGDALDPEVVVVYHQANDFLPAGVKDPHNYLYAVDSTDRQLYERRLPLAPLLRLTGQSRAWKMFRREVLHARSRLPALASVHPGTYPTRVPTEDRRLAWARITDWCRAHEAAVIVVVPFYSNRYRDDRLLQSAAHLAGGALLDFDRWGEDHGFERTDLLLDSMHLNRRGHALLAEQLEPLVLPGAVSPPPPAP